MEFSASVQSRLNWIKEYVTNSRSDGVVLGLSGGKDSAVVAALCAEAGVKICGVYMPILSNPTKDLPFIKPLVEKYGIEFIELSNNDLSNIWSDLCGIVLKNSPGFPKSDMAIANVKPRLRMTTLYALAQVRNYLVVGTDNASEAFVGYFTKWGDGAYDFCPISDLHATEVVALGDELGLPQEITHRVPSAGLWDGQTDEGEMGVTYAQIEKAAKFGETAFTSEEIPAYLKIMKMHAATKHKREPIPFYQKVVRDI